MTEKKEKIGVGEEGEKIGDVGDWDDGGDGMGVTWMAEKEEKEEKHCQRHNGPEGSDHITSSTQILIKLQFRNLD